MALPVALSGYTQAQDGVLWVGPFISSVGNVYVLGVEAATTSNCALWKATDPTSAFTEQTAWGSTGAKTILGLSAQQVGDTLHVFMQSTDAIYYRPWDCATDTWGTAITTASAAPVNGGIFGARRSSGDLIVFYNAPGVANMGSTYGRVAARRITGGAFGTITDIGIGTTANTTQAESVEMIVLGSADRIHLVWSQGNATAGGLTIVKGRCVKSTDNLGGTAPATAAYNVATDAFVNGAVTNTMRVCGQGFCSTGNQLSVPYTKNSNFHIVVATATDADTPTWTLTDISEAAVSGGANVGATSRCACFGGTPYDGTDKTALFTVSALGYAYDKDTGTGWGTDAAYGHAVGINTGRPSSANVYTRGTDVVLAAVNNWTYDEQVLRTTGAPGVKAFAAKVATASSTKASRINRARPLAAKVATASDAESLRLNRLRPFTVKAATASGVRAVLAKIKPFTAKVATASSLRATRVVRAAGLTTKVAASSSTKATRINRAARLTAKVATSSSTKTTRVNRAARLTTKAATASHVRADLTVTSPGGGPKPFAAKVAITSSAKATRVNRTRRITTKVAASSSTKATRINRAARLTAKAATVSSIRATRVNRARRLTVKVATASWANATTVTMVTGGRPKVWTGSTWTTKPAKVWTGSGWVEKPVKVWNGSAWVNA